MASKSDPPPPPRHSTSNPDDVADRFENLYISQEAKFKKREKELTDKIQKLKDELKRLEEKHEEELEELKEEFETENQELEEEIERLKGELELRSTEDDVVFAYIASESAIVTSSDSDDSDEAGTSQPNASALSANESIHLAEPTLTTILYCAYEEGGEKTKFKSKDDKHAEERMLLGRSKQLPVEIWLSRTPCYKCAKLLIKNYKEEETKPKIHAKMVHVGKGNDGKIFKRGNEHQRGLAALIAMGFEVDIMGTDCYKSFIEKQEKHLESCKGYSKEYFRSLYSLYEDDIIIANVVVISGHDDFVILTLFSRPDVNNKMEPIIESTMDGAKTKWHKAFNSYMGSTGQKHWIVFEYKANELLNESINVDVLRENDPPLLITEAAITQMENDVTKIKSLKWSGNCKQWSCI